MNSEFDEISSEISTEKSGNLLITDETDTINFNEDNSDPIDTELSEKNDNNDETTGLFSSGLKSIFIASNSNINHKVNLDKAPGLKIKARGLKKKRALSIVDTFISIFIIGPLVIGQWRGTWTLLDIYNIPSSGWICFILGTSLHWIFAILRELLHRQIAVFWRDSNPVGRGGYRAARLMYTYVFGVTCNLQWRGGWMVLNFIIGDNLRLVLITTIGLTWILMCLRCSRNLIAPPLIIVADLPTYIFNFPTRYKTNTRDWTLYVLDCAFSVGIVGTLVVFVWRGVWVLLELHLFPENREYSSIGSLIIGYIIVAVTFCLQPVMRYACSRLQGLSRLLAADAFLFLSFLGTINVWKGIWSMLDLWFLPEDNELSCWITHVGCFVFLGLLNCSNSILVRGVYIDAEEEEGRCVVFPCHYLRLFFKIEREKKEARRRNLGTLTQDYSCNDRKEAENGALINCTSLPIIISTHETTIQS